MKEKLFKFLQYVLGENDYRVEFFPKERLMELIEFIENNEAQLSRMETIDEMMDFSFGTEWKPFMKNRIDEMKKEKANIEMKDLNEESIVKPNYLDFNVIDLDKRCKCCRYTKDEIEYGNACYLCPEGGEYGCPNYTTKKPEYKCKYGYTEEEIEYGNACEMCPEGDFNGCPNYAKEKPDYRERPDYKAKPECMFANSNDIVCHYCVKKETLECPNYKKDSEIKPEDELFPTNYFNNKRQEGLEDIILKSVDEGSSSATNNLIIDKEPEVAYTKPMKYYTEENYTKDMEELIKAKQAIDKEYDSIKEFEENLEEIENRCGEMNKRYLNDLNKSVEDLINKESEKYEMVNHPSHYNNSSIETIEKMIRIWGKEQTAMWCEMTAFKYRERIGTKPDNSLEQEMGKIKWYESKAKELRT